MRRVALLILLVACGKKHAEGGDRCAAAFEHLKGATGGARYGMDRPFEFGAVCARLDAADFDCLDGAKDEQESLACEHATEKMKEQHYWRRARDLERMNLRAIALKAHYYYREHGALPATAPLTPSVDCCTQDPKTGICPKNVEAWTSSPTWSALGFTPTSSMRAQYEFVVTTDSTFKVRVVADERCAGQKRTWELESDVSAPQAPRDEQVSGPRPSLEDAKVLVDRLCACNDDACLLALGRSDGNAVETLAEFDPPAAEGDAFHKLQEELRHCRSKVAGIH